MAASRDRDFASEVARKPLHVMAFGQEFGRVLSDGQIVGRAEPFAKVFPSSRSVKRAVGLIAWGVLDDIALDASIDGAGRLVAETNARRIAGNLNINRNTVQKHLQTLRAFGFILHEELRDDGTGRYEVSRYIIDPAACIERFTSTPVLPTGANAAEGHLPTTGVGLPTSGHHAANRSPAGLPTGCSPAANHPDQVGADPVGGRPRFTVDEKIGHGELPVDQNLGHGSVPVAQLTSHGEIGQKEHRDVDVEEEKQQQTSSDDGALAVRLRAAGMASPVSNDLVARFDQEIIRDALDAIELHHPANPAGWLVRAISDHWDLAGDAAAVRARRARSRAEQATADRQATDQRLAAIAEQRRNRWAAAVAAALDETQFAMAIACHTAPMGGVGRRSVGLTCNQLLGWAVATTQARSGVPFAVALVAGLASADPDRPVIHTANGQLPELPDGALASAGEGVVDLADRIRLHLSAPNQADAPQAVMAGSAR